MSEPVTAANSRPWAGDEPTFDLCPVSTRFDPETSALAEGVTEKLHTDSERTERIRVVPVHHRPDLLTPCADLINSEWQRSQGARLHFLQKSCPEFPISLILLQGRKKTERLLGHVRLSQVIGHGSSLFVESVVVSKTERGKGYGRILMDQTERYARSRGFRRLCLTTHDKQHFYAHLGYVLSTPVQNAGAMASFVPMEMLLKFSRMPSQDTSTRTWTPKTDAQLLQGSRDLSGAAAAGSPQPCSLPPPPPPPLIPTSTFPPPPIPTSTLPTPAPPGSAGQAVVQTLTDTPYRDAKGLPIFWMHKDI